ncbi:MAG: adenosylcobinamide-phosphate synthase CbiB [Spirulinaceae cyanobacterium]
MSELIDDEYRQILVLLLAATIDYLIGDPGYLLHPVQMMGWVIANFQQFMIKYWRKPWQRRIAGIGLGLGLIVGSGLLGWLIVFSATKINSFLAIVLEIIILASCFAGRSLRQAAEEVLPSLVKRDLAAARTKLSQYVGRDTAELSHSEILRAVLETVAENTTDGVTAPLFYSILGTFIPGIGAVPLALSYKAASTLDSMIGYRQEPFTELGWFSAQLEDYLTWFPCRLTVLSVAVLTNKYQQVWYLCQRDAIQDPSPNSGWSETAFAAALGVQLGGTNSYGGIVKNKPLLGEPVEKITIDKVNQALALTRNCFLLWLSIGLGIHLGLFLLYEQPIFF